MKKGVGIVDDANVVRLFEEDQGPEFLFLPPFGFWKCFPDLLSGTPLKIDPCFLKDAPDESGAIKAALIGPGIPIWAAESRCDRVIKQSLLLSFESRFFWIYPPGYLGFHFY